MCENKENSEKYDVFERDFSHAYKRNLFINKRNLIRHVRTKKIPRNATCENKENSENYGRDCGEILWGKERTKTNIM